MKRAALILVFFVACSPYGRVKNLHSRGTAVIALSSTERIAGPLRKLIAKADA